MPGYTVVLIEHFGKVEQAVHETEADCHQLFGLPVQGVVEVGQDFLGLFLPPLPIPIVSPDQFGRPSALTELTAYRWFIEYGGRYGTNWKNVVSFLNIEAPEEFHIGQCAQHLKGPILMVVATNDEMNGANNNVTE